MTRVRRAWQALGPEQRLAAVAALALFITMFLPWYQQNGVTHGALISRDLNAFAVFSFIEAAILLAALLVLFTLFARAEGRSHRLPGSDGAIVLAAGAWTALLLVVRLFDKPGVSGDGAAADVGVQWGIFFALAAAGLLSYAGVRLRAAGQPRTRLLRSVSESIPAPGDFAERDFPRRDFVERDLAEHDLAEGDVTETDPHTKAVDARQTPPQVVSARDVRRSRAAAKPVRPRRGERIGAEAEQLSFEDSTALASESPSDPAG